jgi:hypothetical protein
MRAAVMVFALTFGVALSARSAIAGSAAAWQPLNSQIPVCWENSQERYAQEMAWVKSAVTDTWQKYGNLSFTGWGTCSANAKGVRIKIDDSNPLVKALGRGLDGVSNGMVLNFEYQKWGQSCASQRESCIKQQSVHEFGHAIGFAHEHNTSGPEVCRAETQGKSGGWPLTIYDPNSIMNYCRANVAGESWQLTDADINGVKTVYPRFTSANIPEGRTGKLITQQSAQCLHVQGADSARRRLLMQWPCQNTKEFFFSFHRLDGGQYQLRSPYKGQCFHYSTADSELRALLMQWECAETEEFRFKIDSAGTDSWGQEWFRMRGTRNGSEACFHILGGPTTDARHYMAAWPCLNGPEFLFTIK